MATATTCSLIAKPILDDDIVVIDAALSFDPVAVVITAAAVRHRGGEGREKNQ